VVSAVWDLLDRALGVHRLSGNDTPKSKEDESSGGSPLGGKDTLLGGPACEESVIPTISYCLSPAVYVFLTVL